MSFGTLTGEVANKTSRAGRRSCCVACTPTCVVHDVGAYCVLCTILVPGLELLKFRHGDCLDMIPFRLAALSIAKCDAYGGVMWRCVLFVC